MAETIYQTGMESYKSAASMPAEMSLLSTKAQAAKLQVEEEKQAIQTRMATRAAMAKAQAANANQDMSTIKGNLSVLDYAIRTVDDPEVKQNLFRQKQGLLSDQAKLTQEQGKAREDQRAQLYESAGEFLTMGPEGGENLVKLGQENDNRLLVTAGLQMQDKLPIAIFGNRKYSQLNDDEKTVWKSTVGRGLEPKAGESAIRNAMREQIEMAQLAEKKRNDDLKDQEARQRVAANREKTQVEREKGVTKASTAIPIALSKLETQTANDVNRLKKQQQDLLIKAGMPVEGVTVEHWYGANHQNLPPEVRSAYESFNNAIDARQKAHDAAKTALGRPTPKKQGTGTKDDPIKLD